MLLLLGGLALFLFGVRLAGENLQALLGTGMRRLLASATRSNVGAALVGTLVTALAQSATLITVLTVNFVDAGVLSLTRALAVALGAGVGGTFTVQLLSLHVGRLTMPLLALGLLLSWPRLLGGRLGRVSLGLGLLFLGLETLLASLEPLAQNALFGQVLSALAASSLVGGLLGFALAVLVQSSNAAATLALAFVVGDLLTPAQGVAIVVGANVGTTLTAALVSRSGSVEGRRVAYGHLGLKVLGALVVIAVIDPFTRLLASLESEPSRLIANAHTLFNVMVLLVALPFGSLLSRLLRRVLPTPPSEEGPRYLTPDALNDPTLAYGLAFRETVRVAEAVQRMYLLAAGTVTLRNDQANGVQRAEIIRQENRVDELVHAVVLYLGQLSGRVDSGQLSALLGIASELEALADLSKRLARQPLKLERHGGRFSDAGGQALALVAGELAERMHRTFTALALRQSDAHEDAAFSVHLGQQRLRHLERLAQNPDSQRSSSVHLDVLTILEQMSAGLNRISRLAAQL
ncbi:Na/Pi cotransporter family protein [Deinococcus peraridilitoris]|uniref:Na+/phosphate symporter n=1 Tax=Deinococcus peraridilitoris (strain DSM 19664 / LMG 22246 / CIP 109416 / KR-200) TaxID=937777 RepID=L0A387_DEIPD|nr:Na/Pi symporter [Deinococcus peraridilitoris]AFZ67909.1 Na+/phosphate symporter [Deinococcus peraridilitoris DSM 19664]